MLPNRYSVMEAIKMGLDALVTGRREQASLAKGRFLVKHVKVSPTHQHHVKSFDEL